LCTPLEIKIDNPLNLELIAVTTETKNNRLNRFLKNGRANAKLYDKEELKHRSIYLIRVRPPVFSLEKREDKIVDEKGYEYKFLDIYVASEREITFHPSALIRIEGVPLPHPRTQKTTLLAYDVQFPESAQNFSRDKLKALKVKFEGKTVTKRLTWILENFESFSHVYGRRNIAEAILLGYFTPLWVCFNGELQRGWGNIQVIGDTTVGKSETQKKAIKLLRAGSLISAETASTVGLTGTATQLEKEGWFIDWGFLPLMDRKLLAIDGAHKLSSSCWAALAEAERSGILSIAKAAKNSTYARTRQIKISNAVDREDDKYSTKSLACFLYPCQALTTILDKTSIARIDVAVFADQRDVTPETINQNNNKEYDRDIENLSESLKWVWGNTAKVEWAENAVSTLLTKATELYKMFFCETIPLITIDTKWKIARLSAALAYLTLSTDDFSTVKVTEEHVQTIVDFLTEEYSKAGLNILAQEGLFEKLTIDDVKDLLLKIRSQIKDPINNLGEILHYIVIQGRITYDILKTKFNLTEKSQARPLMAALQSENLLNNKKGFYPTPKLIEAYKITDGFAVVAVVAASPNEPPTTINDKRTINLERNQQTTLLENNRVRESVSDGGKVGKYGKGVTVVTEPTGLRHVEAQPYFNSCYFCQKPIYEAGAVTDNFTEHKPAHKICYDTQKEQLRSSEDYGEPGEPRQ
jgi:hypothetical protein